MELGGRGCHSRGKRLGGRDRKAPPRYALCDQQAGQVSWTSHHFLVHARRRDMLKVEPGGAFLDIVHLLSVTSMLDQQ